MEAKKEKEIYVLERFSMMLPSEDGEEAPSAAKKLFQSLRGSVLS